MCYSNLIVEGCIPIFTIVLSPKSPPVHHTPFLSKIPCLATLSSFHHDRMSTAPRASPMIPLPSASTTAIASPMPRPTILLAHRHAHLILAYAANHCVASHCTATIVSPPTTNHRTRHHHQHSQSPWPATKTTAAPLNHCKDHFSCSAATTSYAAHSVSNDGGGGVEGCAMAQGAKCAAWGASEWCTIL